MLKHNKTGIAIIAICLAVFLFSQCMDVSGTGDPRGDAYAGSASCLKCHTNISDSYAHTAHFHSAGPAIENTIQGSFAQDSNVFVISSSAKVVMEKRNSRFYQVYYEHGKEKEARPFNIVFGSVKGETYLYWQDNQLFQLPVSYSNQLHNWTNSPGYDSGHQTEFNRQIESRCFECHSGYIKPLATASPNSNASRLDKNSIIYNIDCERCHGPAANHVKYQTENPDQKMAAYMVTCSSLSRQQKTDLCAQCHSGNNNVRLRSLFGFRPGDTLARFMLPGFANSNPFDVHGSQPQLLSASQCFLRSKTLTCTTCHEAHTNERSEPQVFNLRCINCHKAVAHPSLPKETDEEVQMIAANCITCHMPLQSSRKIVLHTSGNAASDKVKVVSHYIAVYPDVTEEVLKGMK